MDVGQDEGSNNAIAGDLGKLKKTDYQNAIKLMTEYYNFTRDIPFEEFCPNGAQK